MATITKAPEQIVAPAHPCGWRACPQGCRNGAQAALADCRCPVCWRGQQRGRYAGS